MLVAFTAHAPVPATSRCASAGGQGKLRRTTIGPVTAVTDRPPGKADNRTVTALVPASHQRRFQMSSFASFAIIFVAAIPMASVVAEFFVHASNIA